jgi:acetyltransferase-like isoleucine patch superfamily enzyme
MLHHGANIYGQNSIGRDTTIGAFCDIGGAVIGDECKIQCHVSIPRGTVIGNRVFIGPGARFANDDRPNLKDADWKPLGAFVEDDAVIGMGALIGAGVRIGKGAFIGMGAVVTKDVPAGETWVGNPARKHE